MTSAVKIYHNPRCSKSRQTLQLIESKGISPVIVEYLKYPPSYLELEQTLDLLGLEPRQLMRTAEKTYKENQLDNPELSREDLIKAMTKHPILIERPIMVHNGKAVIGRPPEKVLEIL
ncbi:MAG: arsenate reductase (glutaredoxin) [Gammaproteobacteria bacterium]|jgi:arsenate reductase